MNQERLHQMIRRPVISEKSTIAADSMHQVIFEVLNDATKSEIKEAVEDKGYNSNQNLLDCRWTDV